MWGQQATAARGALGPRASAATRTSVWTPMTTTVWPRVGLVATGGGAGAGGANGVLLATTQAVRVGPLATLRPGVHGQVRNFTTRANNRRRRTATAAAAAPAPTDPTQTAPPAATAQTSVEPQLLIEAPKEKPPLIEAPKDKPLLIEAPKDKPLLIEAPKPEPERMTPGADSQRHNPVPEGEPDSAAPDQSRPNPRSFIQQVVDEVCRRFGADWPKSVAAAVGGLIYDLLRNKAQETFWSAGEAAYQKASGALAAGLMAVEPIDLDLFFDQLGELYRPVELDTDRVDEAKSGIESAAAALPQQTEQLQPDTSSWWATIDAFAQRVTRAVLGALPESATEDAPAGEVDAVNDRDKGKEKADPEPRDEPF